MKRLLTSISNYAQHRGVSEAAVRRKIKRGCLSASVVRTPAGNKIADVALADREWAEGTDHATTPPAVLVRLGVTPSEASAEEKRWRAKLARLEYRKKAAVLVEASEVEPAIAKEFARCRDRLLRIPADWARRCPGLAPVAVAAAGTLVREALEGLDDVIERGGKL